MACVRCFVCLDPENKHLPYFPSFRPSCQTCPWSLHPSNTQNRRVSMSMSLWHWEWHWDTNWDWNGDQVWTWHKARLKWKLSMNVPLNDTEIETETEWDCDCEWATEHNIEFDYECATKRHWERDRYWVWMCHSTILRTIMPQYNIEIEYEHVTNMSDHEVETN